MIELKTGLPVDFVPSKDDDRYRGAAETRPAMIADVDVDRGVTLTVLGADGVWGSHTRVQFVKPDQVGPAEGEYFQLSGAPVVRANVDAAMMKQPETQKRGTTAAPPA